MLEAQLVTGAARAFFLRINTTASAPKGEGLMRFREIGSSGKSAEVNSRARDV
jgi:hypothetical protein